MFRSNSKKWCFDQAWWLSRYLSNGWDCQWENKLEEYLPCNLVWWCGLGYWRLGKNWNYFVLCYNWIYGRDVQYTICCTKWQMEKNPEWWYYYICHRYIFFYPILYFSNFYTSKGWKEIIFLAIVLQFFFDTFVRQFIISWVPFKIRYLKILPWSNPFGSTKLSNKSGCDISIQ